MALFPDSLPEQMTVMLRTALRIPQANRTVSDFLFRSLLDSPFHPSHPLPPASLPSSLSLHLTQTIDPVPNPLYPPATQHVPIPTDILAEEPPSTGTMVSHNHAIFIPVAALAPYALGYALFHDPNHDTICLRSNPFAPPYAARFVFDSNTDDLLLVTHAGSPPCIGLRAFVNNPNSRCRENYMIAVPPVPYEWPHLPSTTLWTVSNIEFRQPNDTVTVTTGGSSTDTVETQAVSNQERNAVFSKALALLDAALDADPVPSHHHPLPTPSASLQPWPQDVSTGRLLDAPAQPLFRAACDNGGPLRNDVFATLLRSMHIALAGTFYAPAMRLDLIAGSTSSFTGRSALELRVAPPPLAAELRDRFAALYYLAILSVSADGPLIRPAAQRGVPALPGCAACRHRAANIKRFPVAAAPAIMAVGEPAGGLCDDDFLIGLPDDVDLPIIEAPADLGFLTTLDATSAPQEGPHGGSSCEARAAVVAGSLAQSRRRAPAQAWARTLRPRPTSDETEATERSGSGTGTGTGTGTVTVRATTTTVCQCGSAGVVVAAEVDGRTAREKMLEARKKRNRLSAARSNERRKTRVAMLEHNVVAGRERVKDLNERQRAAAEENARLKRLVEGAL